MAEKSIRDIQFIPSPSDSLQINVIIELAEHVAECCINPEATFVEFVGNGKHLMAHFRLRSHRPGYLLEASVNLPSPGTYSYRVVGKILEQTLMLEGTYIAK